VINGKTISVERIQANKQLLLNATLRLLPKSIYKPLSCNYPTMNLNISHESILGFALPHSLILNYLSQPMKMIYTNYIFESREMENRCLVLLKTLIIRVMTPKRLAIAVG